MTAQDGEYIYLAGVIALGIGLAIYARYDYRKRKTKCIEDVKDENLPVSASQVRARTAGRIQTPSEELLHEGRHKREMQQASLESRSLTREEKKELHDAITAKAAELQELYEKLPSGRHKALALTDLESSMMWIIKELKDDRNLPETMLDPATGRVLRRDVRPFAVSYGGQSITVDLPGYYPDGEGDEEDDAVIIGDDMAAVDEALKKLKAAKKDSE